MTFPRLVDAVTLRHFGVTEHLAVLEHVLSPCPQPRWTQTIRNEILAGFGFGQPGCSNVLSASFLGEPHEIATADLAGVMRIRVALGGEPGRPTEHLGEAESIFLVDKLHDAFITDDRAAYDFA